MKILHNHLGYAANAEKRALVQSLSEPEGKTFELIDSSTGLVVYAGELHALGPVDAWRHGSYWAADFSEVQASGSYYVRLKGSAAQCISHVFPIGAQVYGGQIRSNLLHYFKSQRCTGVFDDADSRCPVYESTQKVDVHGGWYDASGDTSKYLSHLSYSNYMNPQQTPMLVWNLFAGRDALGGLSLWEDERIVDEALHGADFLRRMQSSEGYFYTTVFDRWSKDVAQRQICEYTTQKGHLFASYQAGFRQGAGVAIAALARASQLPRHGDFASADYLKAAERGFEHLQQHNRSYLNDGEENIIDDYCALLAATELHKATGATHYAEAAHVRAQKLLARQSEQGWFWANDAKSRSYFHAAEAGLPYVAMLRFLEVLPQAQSAQAVRQCIERGLQAELAMTQRGPGNPFGYPRQFVQMPGQTGKVQFFFPHQNESGYWWQGENARLGSLAAAAMWAANLFSAQPEFATSLKHFAHDTLDWIFGRNPFDACQMQGQGHNNPRYEARYWNAPGGVCNGITSGQDNEADIDFKMPSETDPMHSWRWSEQWIPHGAWLFLALAREENLEGE